MPEPNQHSDTSHLEQLTIKLESLTADELIQRNKITLDKRLSLNDWTGRETLPDEVFDLIHLEELHIYGFNIKSIPKRLYNLIELKELRIRNASIKKFPTELMKLPNLTSLTISSYNLSELPKLVENWTKLLFLDLDNCIYLNNIDNLPPNLIYLDISSTRFEAIPEAVFSLKNLKQLIANGLGLRYLPLDLFKLTSLEALYFSENQLTELPQEIINLQNLKSLVLYNNDFSKFPEVICSLLKLERLSLEDNELKSIPDSLVNLRNLTDLDFANNYLTEIPKVIFELNKLKTLDFQNTDIPSDRDNINEISYLPPDILKLKKLKRFSIDSTYITNIPTEIIEQGIKAIRSYFLQLETQEQDYLFEAKLLILGEPGAGKTTLTRKLEDDTCALPKPEETTRGVDVRQHYFPVNNAAFPSTIQSGKNRDFRLNIWDFGGQEIYKATHRFFLSDRAVYLLVANSRNEDTDFTYWLHMVEIFGGKSPLLIIINEIHNRSRSIDKVGLRGHFENIRDILYVDLDDQNKKRLHDIREDIESLAVKLPHIGSPVPAKWTAIRKVIEENPEHVMSVQEYLAVCKAHSITKATDALVLSQYFHDIGVFLHFQDDELLRKQIFLKPTWATNAVYKVLDHPLLIQQNGRFSRQDADMIWKGDEFIEVKDDLLKLMQRFFLTYKIHDAQGYIVPEKLPANTPDYNWEVDNDLVLLYRYEYFMPKGLLTQFMVKKHQYITNQDMVWRRGVLMYRQGTVAEITETYDARTIQIRIQGKSKRDFMTLLTEELDQINAQYSSLKVEKRIPCNCAECVKSKEPDYYTFSELQIRIRRNKSTIECKKSYLDVIVKSLIDEVYNPAIIEFNKITETTNKLQKANSEITSTMENKKVFISYAHANKKYLDRLLTHFKALKYAGVEVDDWSDKRLKAGVKWRQEIEQVMQECQVAILLISTDFLASDFIMTNELPTLLAAAKERGVDIIPLIVAPCHFKQSTVSQYQAINEPSKPLSSLTPAQRDMVYLDVTARVQELLLPT
jgi:Leucine-rich repeat (LRR) protein/GTPase SAR1 family protein